LRRSLCAIFARRCRRVWRHGLWILRRSWRFRQRIRGVEPGKGSLEDVSAWGRWKRINRGPSRRLRYQIAFGP
jgi:hypothetical protein